MHEAAAAEMQVHLAEGWRLAGELDELLAGYRHVPNGVLYRVLEAASYRSLEDGPA